MDRVFVVEDDDNIRDLVVYALRSNGFLAQGFYSGEEFFKALSTSPVDIIILDIMLPKKDGYEILKDLRLDPKFRDLGIIMLTSKTHEYSLVKALDMGADDYIFKPFGVMELISRVKALSRRLKPREESLKLKGLEIYPERRQVLVLGKELDLTYKEFELLIYLVKNQGLVLTRDQIMNQVWGFDFQGETRTIDVHIRSLRQKLHPLGRVIKTVRNVGYKFEVDYEE